MNERIRELALQAVEKSLFESMHPAITVGEGNGKMTIPLVFAEQFAKLIVKECADFLTDVLDDHFAAEQLEEHFGELR